MALPTPFAESAGGLIYVHPDGSDSTGTGEWESPYETPIHALRSAAAGSRIRMRGGVYAKTIAEGGHILFSADSINEPGTELAPITMESYPGEHAILDGYLSITANQGMSWLRLRDFTVGHPDQDSQSLGIALWGMEHLELDRVNRLNCKGETPGDPDEHVQGILLQSIDGTNATQYCADVRIHGGRTQGLSDISRAPFDHGIYLSYVDGVWIWNEAIADIFAGWGIHYFGDVNDSWVAWNTVARCLASGITIGGTSDRGYPDNAIVEFNLIHDMVNAGAPDHGYGIDAFNYANCTNITVRKNAAYNCVRGAVEAAIVHTDTISGENPRLVDVAGGDFRPRPSTRVRDLFTGTLGVDVPTTDRGGVARAATATPGAHEPVGPGTPLPDPEQGGIELVGIKRSTLTLSSDTDVDRPDDAAIGDYQVLVHYLEDPAATLTPPDGTWTLRRDTTQTGFSPGFRQRVYTRPDDGAPGPYTFTWGGGAKRNRYLISNWRDLAGAPLDVVGAAAVAGAPGTHMLAPGIDLDEPREMALYISSNSNTGAGTGTTVTFPPGFSEVKQDFEIAVGYRIFDDDGPTGDQDGTLGPARWWTALLMALKAAPDSIAPQALEGATIIATGDTVELSWWPSLDGDVVDYVIRRRVGSTSHPFAETTALEVTNAPAVTYEVAARDSSGNLSDFVELALVSEPPEPPAVPRAIADRLYARLAPYADA